MGGSEHLLTIAIQAMLGLAVFSFLEYSIRTVHAPDVINRRVKLICAAGLTEGVLGMWVLMYHELAGMIMILSGYLVAMVTMIWLELYSRTHRLAPASAAGAAAKAGAVETAPDSEESGVIR